MLLLKTIYFFFQLRFKKLNSSEIEYFLLDIFLKKNDKFIDIGSNIGRYSFKASSLIKDKGKVFSFEPSINSFKIQSNLVKFGNFTNITILNLALSDKPKNIKFDEIKTSSYKHIFTDTYTKSKIINSVKTNNYCLDLDAFKFKKIKLIKIDTEGEEYKILCGCKETIKQSKPIIILENNKYKKKIDKLLKYFDYKEIRIKNSRNLIFIINKDYNKFNFLINLKLNL